MSEIDLRQEYPDSAESLCEEIKALESRKRNGVITDNESERLNDLYEYRIEHFKLNPFAWYTLEGVVSKFNFTVKE